LGGSHSIPGWFFSGTFDMVWKAILQATYYSLNDSIRTKTDLAMAGSSSTSFVRVSPHWSSSFSPGSWFDGLRMDTVWRVRYRLHNEDLTTSNGLELIGWRAVLWADGFWQEG
jgi:hypothetical protein